MLTDSERQHEKLTELRDEVQRKTMTLDEERAKGTDATKRLAKAAHEWLELQKQHYAEMEHATVL